MSWKSWILLPLTLSLTALAVLARAPAPGEPGTRYLRIAVAPVTEQEFDIGAALAAMLSRPPGLPDCAAGRPCGVPGLVALAQSGDSRQDMVANLARGDTETALIPADRLYAARCQAGAGQPLYVLGEIYGEALHVLARTRIDSIAGLKGKRVAIGAAGSDERRLAERVLSAHGLGLRDVRGITIARVEALEALAQGRIDALFRIAALPDPAITTAAETSAEPLHLLPVTGEAAHRLSGLHPFGLPDSIPAGTYPRLEAVTTLMQPVLWVAGPALPDALAPKLADALLRPENRRQLTRGGGNVALLQPVALRMPAPLHPALAQTYDAHPIIMACPQTGPR